MLSFLKKFFGSSQDRTIAKYRSIVKEINKLEEKLSSLSNEELKAKTLEFKERCQKGETVDSLLPEAYAVVKNACRRLSGSEVHVSGYDQRWDMVPYDVQLIGAIAMHNGSIAEMQTGEGKTLTATLPLYLNALTGKPVHLVTVNDYLAERDCQWTGSVLRWLGLTTGALTNATPMENRKEIYACDVVYGTASEFGFDYLRDNSMALSAKQQVQRGYYFAIIDEVDSILIDEARTPLIISGPAPESRQMYSDIKGNVEELVRRQQALCNKLATEAKRELDKAPSKEAYHKLWIVSKGMPRHPVLLRIQEDPDHRAAIDKIDIYYHGEQGKYEKQEALSGLYIIVDERGNEYELTDRGISEWVAISGDQHKDDFVMIDISDAYINIESDPDLNEEKRMEAKLAVQEEDALRKERVHNLRQLLKAHLLMEKDVDYIVDGGKIVIIDENTGRTQPGRRFSDGLHAAIEAKESVEIQRETQTYATVTLQNYFRMYEKLSGMTGTAITEAGEFREIYKLNVLQIPTHRACIREDANDEIYMSEREKYQALLKEVRSIHEKGRPILIGTESVEISEKLSRIFRQASLPHVVLNARHNAKEAEVIAHAGKRGAITISTNMAGRGTDIKLDQGVAELGGLYVVGTTRHQSRRIDRQLRGRSARQGDPGNSKFFVSFEDQLLRLFSSPRMNAVLQRFRPPEGEPISAPILNRSIETAQKRVEQRNYNIRKHTLQYDDVMNKQRQEIYAFRNEILQTSDIVQLASGIIQEAIIDEVAERFQSRSSLGGWDAAGFTDWLMSHFPIRSSDCDFDRDDLDQVAVEDKAIQLVEDAFKEKIQRETAKVIQPGSSIPLNVETPVSFAIRNLMLSEVDRLWMRHLLTMDHLRSDVTLRAVGQRDPLIEFKQDAFRLFHELGQLLKGTIAKHLFKFEMVAVNPDALQSILGKVKLEHDRSLAPQEAPPSEDVEEPKKLEPIHVGPRAGRNDPCPCGSGKKYKQCCGSE